MKHDAEQDVNLRALTNPRSIAVVGASQRAARGTSVLRNLQDLGFSGAVHPINPKYEEVLGLECFPNIQALPEVADCVVVAVPAHAAIPVLNDAHDFGVPAAVILSAGFGEGHAVGPERVQTVRSLAREGMAICGPNCYGILNIRSGAAPFSGGIPKPLLEGPVALVSQSGGLTSVITEPVMEDRGIGFSYLISCGNQLGVSVEDFFEFLLEDEETRVIAAFIEAFTKPEKLKAVATKAAQVGKPIVVLKSGRSSSGRSAIQSHTGALANDHEILSALLDRLGIIQAESLDELAELICLLAVTKHGPPSGLSATVVTGIGGEASHAADSAQRAGLDLPALSVEASEVVRSALPEFGSATNPIDGTGAMFENPAVFPKLLDAAVTNEPSDTVLVNLRARVPHGDWAPFRRFASGVRDGNRGDQLIVAYTPTAPGEIDRDMMETLYEADVPLLCGTERAMQSVALFHKYGRALERLQAEDTLENTELPSLEEVLNMIPANTTQLDFEEASLLLGALDIPVVAFEKVFTAEDAAQAATRVGFPVAVKADSRSLSHKTDVGGVHLDCRTPKAVFEAAKEILEGLSNIEAKGEKASVIVQPMIEGGIEVIVGISTDPLLGPGIVFGLGGIYTDIMKDAVVEVPPISRSVSTRMIDGLKSAAIFKGARGRAAVDVDAIAELLVKVGRLSLCLKDRIVSLDLNPVIVGSSSGSIQVVDAVFELAVDGSQRKGGLPPGLVDS